MAKTKIWAHRGASAYAPENTMEAFWLAHKMGADGIEIDVHLSKDGRVIVCHDEDIRRTSSGQGKIAEMSHAQLAGFDFSAGKEGYQNVRVPLLEDVLAFVKETGMELNIELKTNEIQYPDLETTVTRLVREFGVFEQVLYSSFNHHSLMLARACEPECPIGILYSEGMLNPGAYAQSIGANAIHPHHRALLVPGALESCRARGILVHPWTVDDGQTMQALLDISVDAIITNRPDLLKQYV